MNTKTTQRCAEQHGAEASESVNSAKTSQVAISKVSAEYCVSLFLSLIPSEQFVLLSVCTVSKEIYSSFLPNGSPVEHLVSAG